MKKIICLALVVVMVVCSAITLTGCREAERVTYNVSKEADNFNVTRRLVVVNTVTDKPEFELIGRMSIEADNDDNQLEIVVETEKGKYQKHIIGLNDATTMYVVEGLGDIGVNEYRYEINYQPKAIIPIDIVDMD